MRYVKLAKRASCFRKKDWCNLYQAIARPKWFHEEQEWQEKSIWRWITQRAPSNEVLGLHMSMDPVLLDACGDVLAAQFAGVTKVLTGEGMGWDGLRSDHSRCKNHASPPVVATLSCVRRSSAGTFCCIRGGQTLRGAHDLCTWLGVERFGTLGILVWGLPARIVC